MDSQIKCIFKWYGKEVNGGNIELIATMIVCIASRCF